jgi:sarcosine oxidase
MQHRLETEVAVVGLGSMGSLALWELARRGVPAVGIEQFQPGHDRGAAHGESRIFRSCYAEGPEYVPLLDSAFALWRELEAETGADLFTVNGALFVGRPDTGYVAECRTTAEAYELPHEVLDRVAAERRYPQHRLQPDEVVFVDHRAGFVRPEAAVNAAVGRARTLGADVLAGARVLGLEEHADGIEIRTDAGVVRAQQAIVAAGAWIEKLLPELRIPTFVERQVMVWFRAFRPTDYTPERFPIFIRERGEGQTWYGFPSLDGATIKAALHHGGSAADPDALDRSIHPSDVEPLGELLRDAVPGIDARGVRGKACMYTNTVDGHFVIGRPSGLDRLILLGPMADHGFKFASSVGKIGADLAESGETDLPIATFSPDRFLADTYLAAG